MAVFQSKTLVYDPKAHRYGDPVCVLNTDTVSVTLTGDTMQKKEIFFHTDYAEKFLKHTAAADPDKLQRLVDGGEIVNYLDDLEKRCMDAADTQTELWLRSDTEYQASVLDGDLKKAAGLRNGIYQIAKSEVMRTMVLV